MALRRAVADGIATITIDRPGKRNAMTADMWRALPGHLDALAADPAVRVVVLTGAGGDFCAGADIGELGVIDRPGEPHLSTAAEQALAAFPKPTIAAIEGFCVGGGCQLAAACDLRFAAAGARFGITPARLGIVYPAVATARIVRLVGPAAAKYLLFSAELVDAGHALRIGLVDEVVPDVHARVAAFAATLTTRSLLTQQATKQIVDAIAAGGPVEDTVAGWLAEVAAGGDAAEGVAAFLERRTPAFTWTGRS
ncbi:enoyl-CoA hydratase/isomerase family protein [Actinomadura parmotrematis]|uniref:Enoyl-CoA hydratase/isomerase family protein n=1 Tax=Actinomadura parmotrematis TaxID=2864039 RepID=A0ABS7FRP4_9ACTN|nr:enoyl-CoA hydratase/isomerase family protein [Actinomadura parmotrematis]MBW8483031.1 enoyl-CoA hydratase/isomerase family protein [Actinomadura parmotrematis]